jgi:hypothetical protein
MLYFLLSTVADLDPGSGAFFDPWIRDQGSGMGKKSRSGSLENIFWVKILKFFDADADADPGSRPF